MTANLREAREDDDWLSEFEELDQNSLFTFLSELVALLQKERVKIPYEDERPWQKLFYDLKSKGKADAPQFIKDLYFDADGPYLRSRELTETLEGLQLGATVAAMNPTFETIQYSTQAGARLWIRELKKRPTAYQRFVSQAADRARAVFESQGRGPTGRRRASTA